MAVAISDVLAYRNFHNMYKSTVSFIRYLFVCDPSTAASHHLTAMNINDLRWQVINGETRRRIIFLHIKMEGKWMSRLVGRPRWCRGSLQSTFLFSKFHYYQPLLKEVMIVFQGKENSNFAFYLYTERTNRTPSYSKHFILSLYECKCKNTRGFISICGSCFPNYVPKTLALYCTNFMKYFIGTPRYL